MNTQIYKRASFGLSLAGVLFSGYLSGLKFFADVCAFNESCPYFVGYPACYFGFVMFVVLFVSSGLLLFGKWSFQRALNVNLVTSTLGVLFASYFAYPEARDLLSGNFGSTFFGLSTCIYGLIFFILIFVITLYVKLIKTS
jgi:hypothetical protein